MIWRPNYLFISSKRRDVIQYTPTLFRILGVCSLCKSKGHRGARQRRHDHKDHGRGRRHPPVRSPTRMVLHVLHGAQTEPGPTQRRAARSYVRYATQRNATCFFISLHVYNISCFCWLWRVGILGRFPPPGRILNVWSLAHS